MANNYWDVSFENIHFVHWQAGNYTLTIRNDAVDDDDDDGFASFVCEERIKYIRGLF